MSEKLILVINPGSTSTKTAVYAGSQAIAEKTITHTAEELKPFNHIKDQSGFRKEAVLDFLQENGLTLERINCIAARGGLLKPISGGTWSVNEAMCRDLRQSPREHASNLGALIAWELAANLSIPAYIVDPVVVDEMHRLSRFSGVKEIERRSAFHALNQKAAGRKAAAQLGLKYEECNLVVVHLGGGISVGAHEQGRVVDVNNALDGEGPFSPERSGGLPFGNVMEMCYHSGLSEQELKKEFIGKGGLVSYLGTNDTRKVEEMIAGGDYNAYLAYEAMAYQTAKEIGMYAVVLRGQVDAVVLTGGIAHSRRFVQWVAERVSFLAPVLVFPGEFEMEALAQGAARVLAGEETAKIYE